MLSEDIGAARGQGVRTCPPCPNNSSNSDMDNIHNNVKGPGIRYKHAKRNAQSYRSYVLAQFMFCVVKVVIIYSQKGNHPRNCPQEGNNHHSETNK
mmetsp:Transcript_23895/g.35519  ORF Transcript_23895/g.35519 Transcript_23895/m.35519 type:complete len:96 (-) Transcript_23895:94-381(-)